MRGVRPTFALMLLLPCLTMGQDFLYWRVAPQAVRVPDGRLQAFGLSDRGWALFRGDAANLAAPERPYHRWLFASPEGTPIRLPLEKSGETMGTFTGGALNDEGTEAVVGGDGVFAVVDRPKLGVKVFRSSVDGTTPLALIGRKIYLAANGFGVVVLDRDTREETIIPAPFMSHWTPLRVTPNGRFAVYHDGAALWVQKLTDGSYVSYPWSGTTPGLSRSGRYAWTLVKGAAEWKLARLSLATGETESFPLPITTEDPGTLAAATDRYAFLDTTANLSGNDPVNGRDVYVYDSGPGMLKLLSDQQKNPMPAGDIQGFFASPTGARTLFWSGERGVTDLPSNGFPQVYARSVDLRDTHAAVVAQTDGGAETGEGVLSRSGKTVLTSRMVAGIWSLWTQTDGGTPSRLSTWNVTRAKVKVRDITDDGRYAVWTAIYDGVERLVKAEGSDHWAIGLRGRTVRYARIEPVTGAVVAVLSTLDGRARLVTIAPRTFAQREIEGANTPMLDPSEPVSFDAAGGRVAYRSQNGIRVVDLQAGTSWSVPLKRDRIYRVPRLTDDGLHVAVGVATNDARGLETRVYRTRDGAFEGTLPFGDLLPDGQWLHDPYRDVLVDAATGGSVPLGLTNSLAPEGTPVGPRLLAFQDMGPRLDVPLDVHLGNLWEYRAITIPNPETTSFVVRPQPGGAVSISADVRQAGLENAVTWNEVRIDAVGKWLRLAPGTATLPLSEGKHTFEIRARDRLGRTGRVRTQVLTTDATPPSLGEMGASVSGTTAVLSLGTDADAGSVRVTSDNGFDVTLPAVRDGVALKATLGDIESGRTYRFRFTERDRIGNEAASPEETFVG